MKKLIHSFERDGQLFEVVDHNGQLLCCSVKHRNAAIEADEYIGYDEMAGGDRYQTPEGVTWSFEIAKSEVHLEDALYSRWLAETDLLRYIGAI